MQLSFLAVATASVMNVSKDRTFYWLCHKYRSYIFNFYSTIYYPFTFVCYIILGVREALLDTDDHTCPSCKESNISPDSLIANKFLRTHVKNFQNETTQTGYKKRGTATAISEPTSAQGSPAPYRDPPPPAKEPVVPTTQAPVEIPPHLLGMPPQVTYCCQL